MTLSNHVTIAITQDSVGIPRAGFGIPLIASHSAAWVERVRTYTDLAGVAADFAVTTSPEYLAAQAMFSQNPKPEKIKIGRFSLVPTQKYVITPTAVNDKVYSVTCAGEGVTTETVTYTADATATVAEITLGLTTAINGVTGKNFTAVDGTTFVTITGDAAGDWFSLEVDDPDNMKIEQTHADPGIATDLAAVALEDNDWYALCTLFNSNAMVLAADAWIQTQKKIYVFDVNESDAITTAVGNSDTLDDIATLNRTRTAGVYHPSPVSMNAASWLGRCLPLDPGSITWKWKTLSGVPSVTLTATHRTNLVAREANFYEEVASVDIMSEGKTADGDYIDVQRSLDWLEDDMSKGVFGVLANANKIPYTDPGVAAIQAEMEASLQRATDRGILSADPAFVVTVPKVADVSAANKTARLLPDMKFSGTLAGAIHKVNITGVVSV
jgi:hypothetical protein